MGSKRDSQAMQVLVDWAEEGSIQEAREWALERKYLLGGEGRVFEYALTIWWFDKRPETNHEGHQKVFIAKTLSDVLSECCKFICDTEF